jgi:hypothetical protein
MLLLLFLSEFLPVLAFLGCKTLPLLADRLGEISLSLLLGDTVGSFHLRLLAILAALAAEQDERILWSLDIILISLPRPTFDVGRRRLSTLVLLHL